MPKQQPVIPALSRREGAGTASVKQSWLLWELLGSPLPADCKRAGRVYSPPSHSSSFPVHFYLYLHFLVFLLSFPFRSITFQPLIWSSSVSPTSLPLALSNPLSYTSSPLSSPTPLLQLLQSLHTAIANHLSMPEQPSILDQQPGRFQEVHSSRKAAPDSLGLFSHPEWTERVAKTSLGAAVGHEMTDSVSSSSVQRLPKAHPSSVSHLQLNSAACMTQGSFKAT